MPYWVTCRAPWPIACLLNVTRIPLDSGPGPPKQVATDGVNVREGATDSALKFVFRREVQFPTGEKFTSTQATCLARRGHIHTGKGYSPGGNSPARP
jgi:hypothetical protein